MIPNWRGLLLLLPIGDQFKFLLVYKVHNTVVVDDLDLLVRLVCILDQIKSHQTELLDGHSLIGQLH